MDREEAKYRAGRQRSEILCVGCNAEKEEGEELEEGGRVGRGSSGGELHLGA